MLSVSLRKIYKRMDPVRFFYQIRRQSTHVQINLVLLLVWYCYSNFQPTKTADSNQFTFFLASNYNLFLLSIVCRKTTLITVMLRDNNYSIHYCCTILFKLVILCTINVVLLLSLIKLRRTRQLVRFKIYILKHYKYCA